MVCPLCHRVAGQLTAEFRVRATTTEDEKGDAETRLSLQMKAASMLHECLQMSMSEIE